MAMQIFHCGCCGAQVYFDNSDCMQCGARLAFVPDEMGFMAFSSTAQGCQRLDPGRPTENSMAPWLAEAAKRRVLATLLTLGVPIGPKHHFGDAVGLEFVWAVPSGGATATTGHDNGTITLNLLEVDDVHRESTRVAFGEPLRSVLGHLRHELSHRLQQSYTLDPATQETARTLFGDERIDYSRALQTHCDCGPPAHWQQQCISAYASAHPREDWAETCAHYLLMVDAVETASAWS